MNSAPDAAARFDQVQRAFDLLSDPVARAEYDRGAGQGGTGAGASGHAAGGAAGQGTEVAPGIFVRPALVDFGVLRQGRPKAYATVTVTWTGKRPAVIRTGIVGASWIRLIHESPAPGSIVFSLCAQLRPGGLRGRQDGQFTVTLDDTWFSVHLTADLLDTDPGAPPPAPDRQARDSLPGCVVWLPLLVLAFVTALVWPNARPWWWLRPAPSTPAAASPARPTAPVIVEQTVDGSSGATGAIRPVFTASPLGADRARALRDGLAWPPVQRGLELRVPTVVPAAGLGPARFCVSVTVPGTGGTAGRTVTERPLGTVTRPSGPGLTFPSVLPGRYQLNPSCAPAGDPPAADLVSLGTVGPAGLGVTGAGPEGTLVVYDTLDTGASATVGYVAVGPAGSPAPSSQACVIRLTGDGEPAHWRPAQSTVSQRVTGTGEWVETGTLVFHLPPGRPDYFTGDCAGTVSDARDGGDPGVALP